MIRQFVLTLRTGEAITANHRLHWAVEGRRTRELRRKGFWAARKNHGEQLTRADVDALIEWPRADRRRDPDNWAPTIKPLIDGLIDAGVLPDDNMTHRPRTTYRGGIDHTIPAGCLRVTLVFKEASR